jgi:hypothetical protein
MGSFSQAHLNFVLAKVVAITESKSVSLGLRRFEACQRQVFILLEHTLSFIHGWSHQLIMQLVLAKWLPESKSVSLGLRRFETCQRQVFILLEHTLSFIHGWFHQLIIQLVLARWLPESKSVSLGVGSKPSDNIFAVYRSSEVHIIPTRPSHYAATSF